MTRRQSGYNVSFVMQTSRRPTQFRTFQYNTHYFKELKKSMRYVCIAHQI